MAIFSPSGFVETNNMTSSRPEGGRIVYMPFYQGINGFTGDLLTNNLVPQLNTPTYTLGKVYPFPILFNLTTDQAWNIQVVGVALAFKYFPLALNGVQGDARYFAANTPLMPNTIVEVLVNADPNALFSAQISAPNGLSQDQLLTGFKVNANVTTPFTVNGYTYNFAGTTDTSSSNFSYFSVQFAEFDGLPAPQIAIAGFNNSLIETNNLLFHGFDNTFPQNYINTENTNPEYVPTPNPTGLFSIIQHYMKVGSPNQYKTPSA
jgi:hypothetical protein